jgi:protein-S-isoprenylcysteine O-methyltransferase Ste14
MGKGYSVILSRADGEGRVDGEGRADGEGRVFFGVRAPLNDRANMNYNQIFIAVVVIWVASEIGVAIAKRSRGSSSSKDRGSLMLLWIAITIAAFTGGTIASSVRIARMPREAFWIGIALIVLGIIIRAIAIVTLWRYFTVDVAIASGHELVERGMYRFIRHPSYTGSLLSFLGLGFAMRNWISLAVVVIATFLALSYRVRVEEAALIEHFGDRYREYMRRTKRFIPGLL